MPKCAYSYMWVNSQGWKHNILLIIKDYRCCISWDSLIIFIWRLPQTMLPWKFHGSYTLCMSVDPTNKNFKYYNTLIVCMYQLVQTSLSSRPIMCESIPGMQHNWTTSSHYNYSVCQYFMLQFDKASIAGCYNTILLWSSNLFKWISTLIA